MTFHPSSLRFLASLLGLAALASSAAAAVALTATSGTAMASYANLRLAFNAINAGTHGGDVVLTLTGTTTDNNNAALFAPPGAGTPYTTVTIRPSGAAIVTGSVAGSAILSFEGARNVTIDGLNSGGNSLTIQNTSSSANAETSTLIFRSSASAITVTNASILGQSTASVFTAGGNLNFGPDNSAGPGCSQITISNCRLGPVNTALPSKLIYSMGSGDDIPNHDISILNNDFFDFFSATVPSGGIYLTSGNRAWLIQGNRFYQTATRTFSNAGLLHTPIECSSAIGGHTIANNIIGFASNTQTGTYTLAGTTGRFCGILISAPVATMLLNTITGNRIAGIRLSNVSSVGTISNSPFSAIRLSPGRADVTQNVIGDPNAADSLFFSTAGTGGVSVDGILSVGQSLNDFVVSGNTIAGFTVGSSATTTVVEFSGIRMNGGSGLALRATGNLLGTAAGPLQNTSTSTAARVRGIYSEGGSVLVGNTVQNLSALGRGLGLDASVIGLLANDSVSTQVLRQNLVFNLANAGATAPTVVNGLAVNGDVSGTTVTQNVISDLGVSSSGANTRVTGIHLVTGAAGMKVERNLVHSLRSVISPGVMSGIYALGGGTLTLQNNMIRLGLTAAGADIPGNVEIRGIHQAAGAGSYFHNSVYVGGAGASGAGSTYAFFQEESGSLARKLQNNIFVNARSGGSGSHFGLRVNAGPMLTSDYNIFRATGTGGVLGQLGASTASNIAAWAALVGGGGDTHSFDSDPQFKQPAGDAVTGDLHLSTTVATDAEGNGLALAQVTDDFDGQLRAAFTPTDIGADAGVFLTPGAANPLAGPVVVGASPGVTRDVLKSLILAACSDPNGLTLTVTAVGAVSAQGGSVTLGANSATYAPPTTLFTGTDVFSYTIINTSSRTASGIVTVNVQGPAFPPRATTIALTGGGANFSATYRGFPNLRYAIEFSDALPAGFQPLLDGGGQPVTVTADAAGNFTFSAPQSPVPPRRFYRARAQ